MTPRLPAQWEPHEATWLIWPESRDWPGKLQAVRWAYTEMIRWLALSEDVRILVRSRKTAEKAGRMVAAAGADMGRVFFHVVDTDRSWARDCFPAFVKRGSATEMAAFAFTGWARYATHTRDARVPERLPELTGLELCFIEHKRRRVALEGGALDTNGAGTLLVTEECLLHPTVQVRNPGFTRQDYEEIFSTYLGMDRTIWLPAGVAGDDTHGHVDDVCRFVNRDTLVLCREDDPADPNHATWLANREALVETGLNVLELPMPRPLYFDGQRLPASYANFYIGNRAVLVPTFNDPADREALGILARCFPEREVVGIHCGDIILGLGAIHCLTHEQPA